MRALCEALTCEGGADRTRESSQQQPKQRAPALVGSERTSTRLTRTVAAVAEATTAAARGAWAA